MKNLYLLEQLRSYAKLMRGRHPADIMIKAADTIEEEQSICSMMRKAWDDMIERLNAATDEVAFLKVDYVIYL